MRLAIANRKRALALGALVTLIVAMGGVLRGWEPTGTARVTSPRVGPSDGTRPVGLALAWLGGLRPAVAAGCWVRAYLAWEQRDEAATITWLELTFAADARPDYFWINGARMIAYDLPTWKRRPDPDHRERCAQRALAWLHAALPGAEDRAAVMVEIANVHLRVRHDLLAAAAWYRQAAEQAGAPYYAARIHGELLIALGRADDALAWLRQVRASLPTDDPRAQVAVVEARIRALEGRARP